MEAAARRGAALGVTVVVLTGGLLSVDLPHAAAEVTSVTGSAYGYQSDVSLFGGPSTARGPEPTIELAPDASNSPREAAVDSAVAQYGPAQVFRSGLIEVRGEASLGEDGSVTTSTSVMGDPEEDMRPGPLLYDRLESTCTADEEGVETTTTVTGGVVETSYDPETQLPVETEDVPENPEPGYTVEGTIDHVGDRFRIVFNEQVTNDDGSTTVYAAHMYLLGDIAVGDLFVGKSTCGVTATTTETTSTPTPSPTPAEIPTATPTPDVDVAEADDESGDGVPAGLLAGGGLLALAILVALVVLFRRGRAENQPEP